MTLQVKNWRLFQHYKDRSPPWIKLQKSLLDDYDFQCLPIASKALAPMLWLLASESHDGTVESDITKLAFRLRWPEKDVRSGLTPLIQKGFLIDASNPLADCLQHALSEGEGEGEGEAENRGRGRGARKCPESFEVTPDLRSWAEKERPGIDVDAETASFRDYTYASAKTDWPATWRNWMRKAKPGNGRRLTKYEESMKALDAWSTHEPGTNEAPLAITRSNVRA